MGRSRTLDERLDEVEKYGFVRDNFPLDYRGHRLYILNNDAYIDNDGRMVFDFSLHCTDCMKTDSIAGRFPSQFDDQMAGVVSAKIACFETFKYNECI